MKLSRGLCWVFLLSIDILIHKLADSREMIMPEAYRFIADEVIK